MRQYIGQMEQSPFDGTIFSANTNSGSVLTDAYWGGEAINSSQLTNALADLQATHFQKFTDNFLRLNVTPYGPSGGIDWFDDFTSILGNSHAAAKLAHDGGAKGIIIDTEQYTQQIWNYGQQRSKSTKTYAQYAAQARLRGSQIMTAFQQEFPDLTVFVPFAQSMPGLQGANEPSNLQRVTYGLLAPFMDGMFDAAAGSTKIVDGFELGYPVSVAHDTAERIEWYTNYVHDKHLHPDWWNVMPVVGTDPAKYDAHISAGFGTYMDYSPVTPWNPNGTNNFFTPSDLEATLRASLQYVDEYSWLYSEQPRWWTPTGGGPTGMDPAYIAAVYNVVPEPATASIVVTMLAAGAGLVRRRGR